MKKGQNRGNLPTDEEGLWQAVTRHVKAYIPVKKPVLQREKKPRAVHTKKEPLPPRLQERQKPRHDAKGFDRSTEKKLKRGQLPLEGRLDLHGMTQAEAHHALHKFIMSAVSREKRTVLVITGKGTRSEGVLKRMVPLWLEESSLKPFILAVQEAQMKDGGAGALYVRLRKSRS